MRWNGFHLADNWLSSDELILLFYLNFFFVIIERLHLRLCVICNHNERIRYSIFRENGINILGVFMEILSLKWFICLDANRVIEICVFGMLFNGMKYIYGGMDNGHWPVIKIPKMYRKDWISNGKRENRCRVSVILDIGLDCIFPSGWWCQVYLWLKSGRLLQMRINLLSNDTN